MATLSSDMCDYVQLLSLSMRVCTVSWEVVPSVSCCDSLTHLRYYESTEIIPDYMDQLQNRNSHLSVLKFAWFCLTTQSYCESSSNGTFED